MCRLVAAQFHPSWASQESWGIGSHRALYPSEPAAFLAERAVAGRAVDNHQVVAGDIGPEGIADPADIDPGDIVAPADIALVGTGLADIAPADIDLGGIAPVGTGFAQFGAGFAYRPAYRNRSQARACKARRR